MDNKNNIDSNNNDNDNNNNDDNNDDTSNIHDINAPVSMSASEALEYMNEIGVALTSLLVKDFEHTMGMDVAEASGSLGTCRIPINALTWLEIARIVLISHAAKETGVPECDVSTYIKGRGFVTHPDGPDRKALRLAKRRVVHAYTLRHEFQEACYGFTAGVCVRLPAPTNYCADVISWMQVRRLI